MSETSEQPTLFERIADIVTAVPRGMVVTYGQVAAMAGSPRAARQVVRVLHAWSDKRKLPWHRVVNRLGQISLRPGDGYELQRSLLEAEGVEFGLDGTINMQVHMWTGA